MAKPNIIGVPLKTTNMGLTFLVIIGLFMIVGLMLQSLNIYSFEARITDFIVLLAVGGILIFELGVRLPSGNYKQWDAMNLTALVLVVLTILYAFAALLELILPEALLGIRALVLGIAGLIGLYALFTD